MRTFRLAVPLVLGFALGALAVALNLSVRAGGGLATAAQNGDTNGDGAIDVSDAVYLLLHLFKGGPEPVACADTPELLARVSLLEEKIVPLENLPARVTDTAADLATLKDQFEKIGGNYVLLVSNAYVKLRRIQGNRFGLALLGPDPGSGDPPLILFGGTIDAERIRFPTERPGHLLIRLEGSWTRNESCPIELFIDGENHRLYAYWHESIQARFLWEWTAPYTISGDHELVFICPWSGETGGDELPFWLVGCTLTVEFVPADTPGG
ncbi:MAG: hypothetical protein HY721_10490 [Planctomycetes bacterium]|nr:hypothetical protein [Planctomycetota bacterium]